MRVLGLIVALALVVAPAAWAEERQPPAEEPVPVYTNADLERFGPPSGPNEPVRVQDKGEWQFVQDVLDRAYARLDADRRHDLERAEMDLLERPPRPSYALPYNYWGYPGWWGGHGSYRWDTGRPGTPGWPHGARGNEGATRPGHGTQPRPKPLPGKPSPARPGHAGRRAR